MFCKMHTNPRVYSSAHLPHYTPIIYLTPTRCEINKNPGESSQFEQTDYFLNIFLSEQDRS